MAHAQCIQPAVKPSLTKNALVGALQFVWLPVGMIRFTSTQDTLSSGGIGMTEPRIGTAAIDLSATHGASIIYGILRGVPPGPLLSATLARNGIQVSSTGKVYDRD